MIRPNITYFTSSFGEHEHHRIQTVRINMIDTFQHVCGQIIVVLYSEVVPSL